MCHPREPIQQINPTNGDPMQFSPKTLVALTEAVARLATSSGTLRDRLINSERGLARVRPIDLDASQWGDLVRVRSAIRRGGSAAALRRAGEHLTDILVRH